jgi:hypothetical protein
MKKFSIGTFLVIASVILFSFIKTSKMKDELKGAFQLRKGNEEQVLVFADGYFTHTIYDQAGKKFIRTRGGTANLKDGKLVVFYEFDNYDKDMVGKSVGYDVDHIKNGFISDINGESETWTKLDNGDKGLAGLWMITGRQQEGKIVPIHRTGTRKTIKILSSTRFQWAAIDPGKRAFMGTGGGTYSFENGKYTENIEFFSRDSSRVGQSLSFDGELKDGDWHHSGLSSKGDPIYEIWSRDK